MKMSIGTHQICVYSFTIRSKDHDMEENYWSGVHDRNLLLSLMKVGRWLFERGAFWLRAKH